jgi:hypothetical protein
MNVRVVVPPPRGAIVRRAAGYGAKYGALVGAATLVAIGLSTAIQGQGGGFLEAAIAFSPLAAIVGASVGVVCGLIGGVTLVGLRIQAAGSRAAARVIAGAGAALLPGLCTAVSHLPDAERLAELSVTLVTFGIGLAIGPRVLYGKTRRLRRSAHEESADATPQGVAPADTEHP